MSKGKNDELRSTEDFADWLEERHPGQPEYHQAVVEVVDDVIKTARGRDRYRRHRVLQRLTEPDRVISFRVVWEDDNGQVQINRGYRVQQTNALGPYKGGLRFDPTVNESVLKFLAFEQAFKNSLTMLDLGAAKGGADFDPRGRSDNEIQRFCQSFMTGLYRYIGAETDVPAGDIGVGSREIGFLFGQYKRLTNRFTGAVTGKHSGAGGSLLRPEATGYGAIYFLCHMMALAGDQIDGKRVAISGAGNVAVHAAEKGVEQGATVITLSNRSGTLYKADGLDVDMIDRIKTDYPGNADLADIADSIGATWLEDENPWQQDADIAIPSATQNELDESDAVNLVDNGYSYVVEAANMPLTTAAHELLGDKKVTIAPGKAANAGGVAVSGFEIAQNRLGLSWSKDRVDSELKDTMKQIFDACVEHGERDGKIDFRRGANIGGFLRLADALAAAGYV